MKRPNFIALSAVFALFLASCSLDDDRVNFHYVPLEIRSAQVPDTFQLGEVYTIDVNVFRPDECTLTDGFDVRRTFNDTLNIRTVSAIGVLLEQDVCAEVNEEVEDSFQFEVLYTEPYLFRFYTGDDANGDSEFLEIEVPVSD